MAWRPQPRMHGVRVKDWAERAVFVLVFAVGCGGIILLKALNTPAWWPAVFAAGMIALYAGVAMLLGRVQLEPEMVGDNCYYLGFLFTLTSLSYTLAQLAFTDGGIDARTEMIGKVIAGFGVALFSTIVGVFLRVVLMQVRPDIVARDREMHIELHESVREFRRQLANCIVGVKQFTTETIQHAEERDRKIAESLESARATFAEQSESSMNELAAKTEMMISELLDGIRVASLKSAEEAGARLSEEVSAAARAPVERFGAMLAHAAEASEELGRAQGRAAAGIEERSREIERHLRALATSLEDSRKGMESALEALAPEKLAETVSQLRTGLGSSSEEIEAALSRLRDSIRHGTQRLEESFVTVESAALASRRRFPFFGRKAT